MDTDKNTQACMEEDRFNLSRKIFVGNISFRVTQTRLTKFFSKFGKVEYCYLVRDHIRKRPKGIAFITFSSRDEVEKSLQASEQQLTLDRRVMRVSCAEESSRVKHAEGTIWNQSTDQCLVKNIENLHINNNDKNSTQDSSGFNLECYINKLCDDTLILIMSMLPWKQRIAVERVCKKWQFLAKSGWHKQRSIHFGSVFKRFEGLTDTKLCSILVRCGLYIKKLDISASPRLLSDVSIDIIAEQCPNLEDVNLSGMAVTDISLRSLGKKCTKIKSMCLQRCFHVSDKGLQWLFEHCQAIENIDIQGNSLISGNCFQKIGGNCKKLYLSDCCKLTDRGMGYICRNCSQLQELSISNCQLLSDKSFYSISKNLSGLTTVCAGKTFSNVTVDGLKQIFRLSHLRCIIVSQNICVNDEMIETLAVSCPFLQTIDVSGCHRDVTGHGIQSLGFCSSLTSLDISYLYKVDDESIQVLARSGRLKFLTARACSALTDDAFADLACLCPDLELLDVSGCFNVSYKTVSYFLESSMERNKRLTLNIGGTSVEEEELPSNHMIVFCVHDLSQNHLRGDRDIILPEPDPDSHSEEEGEAIKPTSFLALAAGAEIDDDMDIEWEANEFDYDDDLLYGDDPLEMERFELS